MAGTHETVGSGEGQQGRRSSGSLAAAYPLFAFQRRGAECYSRVPVDEWVSCLSCQLVRSSVLGTGYGTTPVVRRGI